LFRYKIQGKTTGDIKSKLLFTPSNISLVDNIILVLTYKQKFFAEEHYTATQKNAVVVIVV